MEDFFNRTIVFPTNSSSSTFSSEDIIFGANNKSKKYSKELKATSGERNENYGWFLSIVNFLIRYECNRVYIDFSSTQDLGFFPLLQSMFPRILFQNEGEPPKEDYVLILNQHVGRIEKSIDSRHTDIRTYLEKRYAQNPPRYSLIRYRPLYYDENTNNVRTQNFFSGMKIIFPFLGPTKTDGLIVTNREHLGNEIINLEVYQDRMNYHNLVVRDSRFRRYRVYGKEKLNYDHAYARYILGQYLHYCVGSIDEDDLNILEQALNRQFFLGLS